MTTDDNASTPNPNPDPNPGSAQGEPVEASTPSAANPQPTQPEAATPAPEAAPTVQAAPATPDAPAAPEAAAAPADDAIAAEMEKSLAAMEAVQAPDAAAAGEGQESRFWRGKIAGITGDDVFVELGPRMQGVIPIAEFDAPPRLGESFDFVVRGQENELYVLGRQEVRQMASWRELEKGKLVTARVTGQNTGGLELKIGPTDAFMPASHVALQRVEDLSALIGENLTCQVIEVDRRRKRVTLSRRAVLEVEERKNRDEALGTIELGQIISGTVKRLESFGAFVEIRPGVDGLLHVSQISRKRVNDPKDVLKAGQKVEVQIIKIEEGGRRIGLGMKQLEPDPWDNVEERLPVEAHVTGKIVRLASFGAFVDVGEGIEGLCHVSQLGGARGRPVTEQAKVGEEVEVRVLDIDRDRERVSLSRLDSSGNVIGTGQPPEGGAPEPERGGGGKERGGRAGGGRKGGGRPRRDGDGPIDRELREQTRYTGGGVNLGDILRKALDD